MRTQRVGLVMVVAGILLIHMVFASGLRSDEPAGEGMADRPTYLKEIVAALKTQWPHNRTINIVCHGHSVPAGYFATPVVDTFNAYPYLLHKTLKERYPYAVINVIVTAIGGESSDRGAERFERDVLNKNPNVVLIDYALSDRRIGLENARQAWAAMITAACRKGIKVILLTPTGDTRAKILDDTDPLSMQAAQIRQLAKEHNVALADSYAAFQDHVRKNNRLEDLMSQVNHPNAAGHRLVVNELMKWFPE